MITFILVAAGIILYACVAAVTMVRFVAADMQHYWSIGVDYKPEDLSQGIVAGGVRGIVWPVTFTLTCTRNLIHKAAYRIAVNWWDEHQYDPPEDVDPIGDIRSALSTGRHSA